MYGYGICLTGVANSITASTLTIKDDLNVEGVPIIQGISTATSGTNIQGMGINNTTINKGSISVQGGNILGQSTASEGIGIYNEGATKVTITGTTQDYNTHIEGTSTNGTGIGIQNKVGTLLLTNGSNTSINEKYPEIEGLTYGVDAVSGSTFNFYDGKVTGTNQKALTGINPSLLENTAVYPAISTNPKTAVIKQTVKIIYDANGGTGAPQTQVGYVNQNATLSATTPVQTGYKFIGWNTDKNAKVAIYNPGVSYKVTADLYLYAIWEKLNGIVPTIKTMNLSFASVPDDVTTLTSTTEKESYESSTTIEGDTTVLYDLRIYRFQNDITIPSGETITFGETEDVGTATTDASRMVVVVFEGNLTNNGTITAVASSGRIWWTKRNVYMRKRYINQ